MSKKYELLGFKNKDIDKISLIKEEVVARKERAERKSCSCKHSKK